MKSFHTGKNTIDNRILAARTALFLVFSLAQSNASAQMKWKTDYHSYYKEEYQAIQGIRHGAYVRLSGRSIPYIHIFGRYVQNMRKGNWYFFYPANDNPIYTHGQYYRDKKEGLWFQYYPPSEPRNFINSTSRAAIVASKDLPGERFLVYDTTGQQLMSRGLYVDDKKVDNWNYFDPSGLLLHSYDHTSNKLITNNLPDSLKRQCTFLGGPQRLLNMIIASQADGDIEPFGTGQEAIVIIGAPNEKVTHAFANPARNRRFEKYVLDLFEGLPNEWLVDENDPRTIKVRVTTVKTEYSSKLVVSFIYNEKEAPHW